MEDFLTVNKRHKRIRLWTSVLSCALVASVAVFCVMLQLEKRILQIEERELTYIVAEEIAENEVVTEGNIKRLFRQVYVEKSMKPKSHVIDTNSLLGKRACVAISEGTVITEQMFEEVDNIASQMHQPVIAGFRTEDLSQVVGGILRAGDRIHIYVIDKGNATPVWENVAIHQVFDGTGMVIPDTDQVTAVQRINIYLEEEDVADFYSRLSSGSIRVVKIIE